MVYSAPVLVSMVKDDDGEFSLKITNRDQITFSLIFVWDLQLSFFVFLRIRSAFFRFSIKWL